ncbi:hypothetical protein ACFL1B_06075 [Nanoarchaeota archaeon]
MNKRGVVWGQILAILLVLIFLGMAFPPMLRAFRGSGDIAETATACKVSSLGSGTCKTTCDLATEFIAPFACDSAAEVCCVTIKGSAGTDISSLDPALLPDCTTPDTRDTCSATQMCDEVQGQPNCIPKCDYCASNPDGEGCPSDITSQHSCRCSNMQASNSEYDVMPGLCPSTNPSDDNFLCCTRKRNSVEEMLDAGMTRADVTVQAQLDHIVSSLDNCMNRNSPQSCMQLTATVTSILNSPARSIMIENGGDTKDNSARIWVVDNSGGATEVITNKMQVNFDFCGCIKCGLKLRDVRNSMRLYKSTDGRIYYSVLWYPDPSFTNFIRYNDNWICAD